MIALYIVITHYGIYYTGITNSLIRRWYEHISQGRSWLSKQGPKEVVYVAFFESRKEAAKEERKVKRTGAKKYIHRKKWNL